MISRLVAPLAGAVLLAAPIATLPAQAPRPATIAGMSTARLERITPIMQGAVDSGTIAGAVVLVLRHGQVVYNRAFGWRDREARIPLRTDALFRIASQTKAITSVALMTLVEEGRVRLGDPVSKWLPGLGTVKVAVKSDTGLALVKLKRAITIRDLLTHSAGISYGTDELVRSAYAAEGLGPKAGYGWYTADKTEPICASMDRIGKLPIVAQPGEAFVYGYNTDILGCVVERVSGTSLADFFATRIFGPLGMKSTWFFPPAGEAGRLAVVYSRTDSGLVRAVPGPMGQGDYIDGPRVSYAGGAGLVASAGDYGRFLQMLANGGTLNGARVLGPRTIQLMTSDHLDSIYSTRGLGFGLGFEILEDPGKAAQFGNPGRFGWGGAYASNYWVDPKDGIVCVFMTQLLPNPGLDLPERLRPLIYQAVLK